MEKKTRIINFDINELLKRSAKSDRMAGFIMPENIKFDNDEAKASISFEGNNIYFALAYIESTKIKTEGGNSYDDLIADIWKNSMLDEAYNILHEKIEGDIDAKGMYLSPLLGPGYYEMPISYAYFVCEKASAESIGITCSERGSMNPAFSRCGFFAVSSEPDDRRLLACKSCKGNRKGCSMCTLFTVI